METTKTPLIDEIIENFSFLDEWEDRYRYIIELGAHIPNKKEGLHQDKNKISGCASQVWFTTEKSQDEDPILTFYADSDAHIVKGLITILLAFYNHKTASFIQKTPPDFLFEKLHLSENLSRQRANGLMAMIEQIKKEATQALISA